MTEEAKREPALEIVFRYLMLLYNPPQQGLKVLVPRENHRAHLRDTANDTVIPLSETFIRVEVEGNALKPAQTKLYPKGLVVAMEKPLKLKTAKPPNAEFLETDPVSPSLNALVHLPGGDITAYPSEAFPERADDLVTFDFGSINNFKTKVTDTTVYRRTLTDMGVKVGTDKVELVVATRRRTLRIDISSGGRFELRNVDEKFGETPNEKKYHTEEFRDILRLLGKTGDFECDTHACGKFYCGDPQGFFKDGED